MDMKNFKIIDNDRKYFIDGNGSVLKAVSLGLTKDEKGSLCELFVPEIFLNTVARLPVLDNDKLPFFQEKSNRKIVCLCGSTKFKADFERANREETAKGNIVLTVAMFGHLEGLDMNSEEKKTFAAVHYDKIKLADEVLVINTDNYIGESTRKEIEYAEQLMKPIRYLEPIKQEKPGYHFEEHNYSVDDISKLLTMHIFLSSAITENEKRKTLIKVLKIGKSFCNNLLSVWIDKEGITCSEKDLFSNYYSMSICSNGVYHLWIDKDLIEKNISKAKERFKFTILPPRYDDELERIDPNDL